MMNFEKLLAVARGDEKAELVLKNAQVLNVFTEEILSRDVAICQGQIAGVGAYEGVSEIDCTNKYVVPGFIDAHIHIESSMVTPLELSKLLIQTGTTGIVADPHEIVNVAGGQALDYLLAATEDLPVDTYVMIPSSVPATDIDVNGAGEFLKDQMEPYVNHPRVLGLGEAMRFVDVVHNRTDMMDKLHLFEGKVLDGHSPGLSGKDLQAYRAAGILNDHECASAGEALEKARAGFTIFAREGSGAKNIEAIAGGFIANNLPWERCCFCADDRHLADIRLEGHINHCVQKAIACGVPVIKAYKMGSYYTAQHYGLKKKGAVAAGFDADLLILDDLNVPKPIKVLKGGKVVDTAYLEGFKPQPVPENLLKTVTFKTLEPEQLKLAKGNKNHVIEIQPYQLITRHLYETVPGEAYFEPDQTYNKLCVAERYGKTGGVGVAPIKGFNIKNGAIATSVSHDSHNIIGAGDNDTDMALAINRLKEIQGGYVIASQGKILGELPLTLGGLMSLEPNALVEAATKTMIETARTLGVGAEVDPFITLSFMALTVIPEIRLTEKGLFDVNTLTLINETQQL